MLKERSREVSSQSITKTRNNESNSHIFKRTSLETSKSAPKHEYKKQPTWNSELVKEVQEERKTKDDSL